MNTKIRSFAFCLTVCLLTCVTGHAYEQDNWYIAWEVPVSYSYGVAYWENNNTGVGQIYLCNGSSSSSRISVYDLNGSLDRHITIAQNRYYARDLELDQEGNIYIGESRAVTCLSNDGTFKWRKGKGASISSYGSSGSLDGEFYNVHGLTIGPDGNLYVADYNNDRIQVLDKNGTFIRKFGQRGTAPGQLVSPRDVAFLQDGTLVVGDANYLNFFDTNGTFIRRSNTSNARENVSVSPDNTIWSYQRLRDESGNQITYISSISYIARTLFTPNVDLIEARESSAGYLRLWKRAYRTKGLPQRNVIPQPKIHKIAQRSGTNVLDLDFEIIDSDDTNATVGIMAYAENARVVPQAWTDGTGSKIGTPIATNQVHRVSWDVKQDWNTSTGTIKFEILCQDGRTNKPVDVHFITLPLADGNLTISRSPIKDADIENYLKYLVAIGSNEVAYENSTITNGNGTIYLNASKEATAQGKTFFMTKLGHRWATATEVNNAKVAATPGTTNVWAASRQVSPRYLPKNVNEYGFDTGNHGTRAWWVVKE